MSIGLVQNARDKDMIEICGSRDGKWQDLWGTIHCDGIGDAIEGELCTKLSDPFKELVECVIITEKEWEDLRTKLEDAETIIEEQAGEIAELKENLEAVVTL